MGFGYGEEGYGEGGYGGHGYGMGNEFGVRRGWWYDGNNVYWCGCGVRCLEELP
jgi:hypothetical protein